MLRRLASVLVASCLPIAALAAPPGTGFNYQGILKDGGTNANGVYDMRISLRSSPTSTSSFALVGPVNYLDNVPVTNGQFTVQLDYGNQFNNSARYLQIEVRKDTGAAANTGDYDPELLPRPQIVAVPVATNSINLNGQPGSYYQTADNLTGTLPAAMLSSVPKLNLSSNSFSGFFEVNTAGSTNAGNMLISTITGEKVGLVSQNAGHALLNLDGNLIINPATTSLKGGAVRIDLRPEYPTIQLLTRPAGTSTPIVALSVEESGNVNITKMNRAYPVVAPQKALRTLVGSVKKDGTTTMTGFTVRRYSPGSYEITSDDNTFNFPQGAVQASSSIFTTVELSYTSRFYVFTYTSFGNPADADFMFIAMSP